MRFYGGSPIEWLTVYPVGLVRAHIAMIERLEAGESLLTMQRVAMGSGTLKPEAAAAVRGAWLRSSGGTRRAEPASTPNRAALVAFGIGVRGA